MSQDPTTPYDPRLHQPIEAKPLRGGFHFWKFTVIGLAVMIYGGGFFLYDGLVKYPAENERYKQVEAEIAKMQTDGVAEDDAALLKLQSDLKDMRFRDDFQLNLQVLIGVICAPAGLVLLLWHFNNFKGRYRLENDVLTLPNRKQVPLNAIKSADTKKWWNKGLAFYEYETADDAGKFKLDALAYEPRASDGIAFAIGEALNDPLPPKPIKTDEPAADTTSESESEKT